jgi:peptidoglycan/LPS O-acetylase OafA/YrhL
VSNTNTGNTVKAYRPDIDGLRALAVLFVVAYHAFPAFFKGCFIGVDVFFVISGFLICGIILTSLESNTFSIKGFYRRRIYRLFPALITVLLATMGFGWFSLFADEYTGLGKHIAGGAGFVANLVIWQEIDYWDIATKLKPLLHLWSLGVEEQYYIIFPCMLLLAWKKKFKPTTLIAVMLLFSFACNIYYYKRDPGLNFYAPYTRFWELMVGAFLAAMVKDSGLRLHGAILHLDYFLARLVFTEKIPNDGRSVKNLLSVLGISLLFLAVWFCRADANYPGIYAM